MKLRKRPNGILAGRLAACGLAGLMFAASATAGEIAQSPLTVSTSVKPNVALTIDDSGSMDFEALVDTSDGSFWWNTGTGTFWGTTTGAGDQPGFNFNTTGAPSSAWKKYSYLFPNGGGAGNRALLDGTNAHFAVPPTRDFAFARSSDYNRAFYNPLATYEPWPNGASFTFANANPTAARSDPVFGSDTDTLDLTTNKDSGVANWTFRLSPGMRRADGSVTNTQIDRERFSYFPATYYQRRTAALAYSIGGSGFNCASPNPAAHGAYVAASEAAAAALAAQGIDSIAPDGHCLKRYEIKPGNSFPSGRSYAAEIQNFANWFQYHRKRHLALRNGMGKAFKDIGGIRIGAVRINASPLVLPMWDIDSQRDELMEFLYRTAGLGGTPNRQAADFVRKEFADNRSVIELACQQNFNLHFTDGFSQVNTLSGVDNADGGQGVPFADAFSNTLADIAMSGYRGPLRTDLARGEVPVAPQCNSANPPRWLDCNRNPHVNFFGITLGAQGLIFGRTLDSVRDAHDNPPAWADPNALNATLSPIQIDDLYHAAVNGRGEMLNARASDELADTLRQALRSILDSVLSSTATTAANSARLDTNTLIFQARFSSEDWTGEVIAFEIDPDGSIGAVRWNSNSTVPPAISRNIFVRGAAGVTEFRWANLTPAQQVALSVGPGGVADDNGALRVEYLRGSDLKEQRKGGIFRNRSRPLGDIVGSGPVFVHAADFGYDRLPAGEAGRDSYQTFRQANLSRKPMLYLGANDGMLHAFEAETGRETWAFIPSELVGDLAQLSDPNYRHRFFMDGQAVAGDALIAGQWRTILVAPTGAGGKSIVAVDVTDPGALGAGSVLWEFTDSDLGSVLGRPSIVRMANGEWVAMFSNGYDVASPPGRRAARLFIVRLSDGALLTTISTVRPLDEAGAQPNGLSPPFPVDINGDAIADLVYAGDLFGNLWKFEVDGPTPGTWDVAYSSAGGRPAPLITVCASGDVAGPLACPLSQRQPITGRPVVGRGPGTGLSVFFGTGKFFEVGDNVVSPSDPRQSFYGVFDPDNRTPSDRIAGRSELTPQQIIDEVSSNGSQFRVTSNTSAPLNSRGWYMDLVSPVSGFESERVVSDPILRGGRIIFTTLIPSPDPCEAGGSSWLMELDSFSGGRFPHPVLDVNGDGHVDDGDLVNSNAGPLPPSGRRSEVGITEIPSILEGEEIEHKISSGTSGGIESVGERRATPSGRQSWRQLWP